MIRDFKFQEIDNASIFLERYIGHSKIVKIPAYINGKKVITIGVGCFQNNRQIQTVIIPNTVHFIKAYAFADCNSLTSIIIPHSVFLMGNNAFSNCINLKEVTIPNGLLKINSNAFGDCAALTDAIISDSVNHIGKLAFNGCNLSKITVDENNKNYSSQDGVLFNKNKTELIQYPTNNPRKTYKIPDSVKIIDDEAFCGCKNLTSITIPDSVMRINTGAFNGCKGLTNVTVPKSVQVIFDGAFWNCPSLTDIFILSKDCRLCDDFIPAQTIIHSYAGSVAEIYAKFQNYSFKEIK